MFRGQQLKLASGRLKVSMSGILPMKEEESWKHFAAECTKAKSSCWFKERLDKEENTKDKKYLKKFVIWNLLECNLGNYHFVIALHSYTLFFFFFFGLLFKLRLFLYSFSFLNGYRKFLGLSPV